MSLRRRRAAVAAVLLCLLAACSSGGGEDAVDDPLAPAPSSTAEPAAAGDGATRYGPPAVLGMLADPQLTESSGLVASRRNPGSYWTHNDSGGGALLYCLGGRGEACGVWRVTGADAWDWEDIAAGPGPQPGVPYLYVGDIGDNAGERADVVVYRVPEPVVGAAPSLTEAAEALRLRYPDGPHDAEALLVHPETGDLYVVTKETRPGVYVARAPVTGATAFTKVAELGVVGVTGGDISPDGRRVAFCDYVGGFELRLPDGAAGFDEVWRQSPQSIALGSRPQGEAVAYRLDGKALLATSERPRGLPALLIEVTQTG